MGKRRHDRSVGITTRALMLLAAFLLFLTYASMLVNPAKAWYMTVIGLLFIPVASSSHPGQMKREKTQ